MTAFTWLGGNGDWNTADSWSPSGVPGASDDAAIDASGTYTVTVSQANSVDNLTIGSGATLAMALSHCRAKSTRGLRLTDL